MTRSSENEKVQYTNFKKYAKMKKIQYTNVKKYSNYKKYAKMKKNSIRI